MPPTYGHGKVCYLEVPSRDIAESAAFYSQVFGWAIRTRSNGSTAFDDGVGQVSGAFVLGRPPGTAVGVLIYVMVDSVEQTCRVIEAHGGTIVQPIGADAPEITARFRDPAGNILALYQEPG
jgi:predicted enzyme related to lactoylglutathione lyase